MENRIPVFKRGNILTKEMLSSLRDRPLNISQIFNNNLGDGIISGFAIDSSSEHPVITVKPGLFKYNKRIYILNSDVEVKLDVENGLFAVCVEVKECKKAKLYDDGCYNTYPFEIVLKNSDLITDNCIEICRFGYSGVYSGFTKLSSFKDFNDISTNFIDYRFAKWADNCEAGTLNPILLKLYAKDLLSSNNAQSLDMAFIYQCLNSRVITRDCILAYLSINGKLTSSDNNPSNQEIYSTLKDIANDLERNSKKIEIQQKKEPETPQVSVEI